MEPQYWERQGLCDSRIKGQFFEGAYKSTIISFLNCAWELLSCDREITKFRFSYSGTLSGLSLESHQTLLGSLLSGAQRGLTSPVDYHVHGSPPGSRIKQKSRLPEFRLWFSHGLAGFISWAGGRMKRNGGGSFWGREGPLEPKAPLLHFGLDLRKAPVSEG